MDAINDGGPAFPVLERGANGLELTCTGMSQRALFAAILMHSELTTCGVPGEACEALIEASRDSGREVEDQMATNAVQCADALLRALAEPAPPRLTYDEQKKLHEHEKMLALLQDISNSGSIRYLPQAQRDAIERVIPNVDDEKPF